MKPLIKSPTLRNALRYWAEYNEVEKVKVYIVSYDRGGVFIADSTLVFHDIRSGVDMFAWRNDEVYVKKEKIYSIKDLIGDKE